jgi:hypothetical protein
MGSVGVHGPIPGISVGGNLPKEYSGWTPSLDRSLYKVIKDKYTGTTKEEADQQVAKKIFSNYINNMSEQSKKAGFYKRAAMFGFTPKQADDLQSALQPTMTPQHMAAPTHMAPPTHMAQQAPTMAPQHMAGPTHMSMPQPQLAQQMQPRMNNAIQQLPGATPIPAVTAAQQGAQHPHIQGLINNILGSQNPAQAQH